MADEQETSTVAEDVSTSASAEPVEETTTDTAEAQTEQPRISDDAWDFGSDEETTDTTKEAPPAEEKTAADAETKETGEKEDAEKSLEEKALEEAFSDADEKEAAADEKDEDLDTLDPKEQIERQRNARARLWAERNAKKAEIVKDFQFDDKPIAEVATRLEEISPQRFVELSQHAAHKLVDANPDAAFQRAYAVRMLEKDPNWDIANAKLPTLDEFIAAGSTRETPEATETQKTAPPATGDLAEVTKELNETIGWDWRNPALDENFVDERELAMAKTIRALEAKAAAESTQNSELNEKLKGLTTNQQSVEQEAFKSEVVKEINIFREEIEKTTLPYILKNTGLEVNANDTPEVKAFKELRQLQFRGTEYERANGFSSQFESFAYNESTVRNELEATTNRIAEAKTRKVLARQAGNKADEDKYQRAADDEKLPLSTLLGQALKEYKVRYIAPDLAVIGGLSAKLTEPIKEASERVEVVSNGSGNGVQKPRKKNYETADDVWGGMVTDAAEEERLRSNA